MRPLAALLTLGLAVPAAAEPYAPPPADAPACERALTLLESRGDGRAFDATPEGWLGLRAQPDGPRRGVFLVKIGQGKAFFLPLHGAAEPEERVTFETRRDDGTALFVEVLLAGGRYQGTITGPTPPAKGWTPSIRADFTPEGYAAFLGARLTGAKDLYAKAYAAARREDQSQNRGLEMSAHILTCPRLVYGAAIVRCRLPGNQPVVDAESEFYCKNVSVCFSSGVRVPFENAARCGG